MPKPLHDTGFGYHWHWILTGFVVGLLWIGIAVGLALDYSTVMHNGQMNAAKLARAFKENLTRTAEGIDQLLVLSRETYLHDKSGLNLTTWMRDRNILTGLHVQLAITDAAGTVIWPSSNRGPLDDVSIADRPLLLAQKNYPGDTLYINHPIVGRVSGKRMIQFIRKIMAPDGSFDGVVVASLDPDYLSQFFRTITIKHGLIALSLQDGTVLAQVPDGPIADSRVPQTGILPVESERSHRLTDNTEHIISVRRLEQYPLTVSVELSTREELADFYRLRRTYLTTGTILTVLGVLIGFVLTRQRRALLESRKVLSATVENISEGVGIANAEGRILFMNQRALKLLNFPPEFATGACTNQQGLELQAARGDFGDEETRDPDLKRKLALAWNRDRSFVYERRRSDGTMLEVRGLQIPGGGDIRIFADITERKRNETTLLAAQTRAEHAERMQALGQLAGGIAHDFNNILQVVQAAGTLIENRVGDSPNLGRLARMILDVTARGTSITGRLLAFARRGELHAEPINCAELLSDLREVLTHTLESSIRVDVSVEPDLPPLFGDKGQLQTVLVNLATNARDAMPGGGLLSIRAAEDVGTPGCSLPEELRPGRYIKLTVCDNGSGMDQSKLGRVLEPFFSTKPVGQGTGLGLSMAKGFAEQSGGCLSIQSDVGKGTKVHIWLPVAPAGEREITSAQSPLYRSGNHGRRILFSDDDNAVRETVSAVLEDAGYTILQRRDGAEALALLASEGPVDVLVTDLSMPQMDGIATIRCAHQLYPDLPAVLLTGNPNDDVQLVTEATGPLTLLRKPVTVRQLIDSIEASLSASAKS